MTTTSANLTRAELPVVQEAPPLNPDQQKWPLKIYTFGRFGLVRDGVPIHFAGKVPRKPLELLKALIACGAGVSPKNSLSITFGRTEMRVMPPVPFLLLSIVSASCSVKTDLSRAKTDGSLWIKATAGLMPGPSSD